MPPSSSPSARLGEASSGGGPSSATGPRCTSFIAASIRAILGTPRSPPPRAPRLINIGRLSEQKGQLILVEAAARLRAKGRDFEIVLIGGGPLREAIEERIRQLDLGST